MKGKAPQEAQLAWENSSLGFIEAIHHRKRFDILVGRKSL